MSDAARLASVCFSGKPAGTNFQHYSPTSAELTSIIATSEAAVIESAYAAALSYAEAISGLQKGSVSWSIVKFYYSCFYCIRASLFLNGIVPFHGGKEMILDTHNGKFFSGGRSSHHWNWNSIRNLSSMHGSWIISQDSQDSYEKLREHRENVNYTHGFTDPYFHRCLISSEQDLAKRIRAYRDDVAFFYTYLPDHLAIAYPTKLIFNLDNAMQASSIILPDESLSHLKKIWVIKDRCPIT